MCVNTKKNMKTNWHDEAEHPVLCGWYDRQYSDGRIERHYFGYLGVPCWSVPDCKRGLIHHMKPQNLPWRGLRLVADCEEIKSGIRLSKNKLLLQWRNKAGDTLAAVAEIHGDEVVVGEAQKIE